MSKKQIIRLVLFLLALGVAVYAFTRGVLGIGTVTEGYNVIELENEYKTELYDCGITLNYYVEGSKSEIKRQKEQAASIYAPALMRAVRLLDESTEYEGTVNLASVGLHPGKTVTISKELYDVLSSALAQTNLNFGYSVFAGVIESVWQDLLYLDEPGLFDPANNPATSELLSSLAGFVNDDSACRLILDESAPSARLELSNEFSAFLTENGLTAPVLSLSTLKSAYICESVAQALAQAGYTKGYLVTDSGLCVNIEPGRQLEYRLFTAKDNEVTDIGGVSCASPSVYAGYVQPTGSTYGAYVLNSVCRHPYFDAKSGVQAQLLSSLQVISEDFSPASAEFIKHALLCAKTPEELASRISLICRGGVEVYYTLLSDPARTLQSFGA